MTHFTSVFGGSAYPTTIAPVDSAPVEVAPGAAPHTKGAWVELVNSTAVDGEAILIFTVARTRVEGYILDLAIGSPGAEQIILENLYIPSARTSENIPRSIEIPYGLPKGTRISARGQQRFGTTGSMKVAISMLPRSMQGNVSVASRVETWGVGLGNTTLTSVPAGNGVYGSYKEFTSATNFPYSGVILCYYRGVYNNREMVLKLAVGAGGAEVDILVDFPFTQIQSVGKRGVFTSFLPLSIREGSRLTVAALDPGGTDGFFMSIIGVR